MGHRPDLGLGTIRYNPLCTKERASVSEGANAAKMTAAAELLEPSGAANAEERSRTLRRRRSQLGEAVPGVC